MLRLSLWESCHSSDQTGTKRAYDHGYCVDTYLMGNDWERKFDFPIDEGLEVVYLFRSLEISAAQIKKDLHKL